MKERLRYWAGRAVVFGAVMAALSFFRGWLRWPFSPGEAPLPLWFQLGRIFLLSGAVFWVICLLVELAGHWIRSRKG